MKRCFVWICGVVMMLVALVPAERASAQGAAGCSRNENIYTCDWETARQALAAARTVTVPVSPMDRFTARQLRDLVSALGKSVAAPDQRADLMFSVVPVDSTGIEIGPADQAIATLQVYATGAGGKKLLWVETYRGQPDRPWAAEVKALIDQFRGRVKE